MPCDLSNQTTLHAHHLFELLSLNGLNLTKISSIGKVTGSINYTLGQDQRKTITIKCLALG